MLNISQDSQTIGAAPRAAREEIRAAAARPYHRTMGNDWNMSAKRSATGSRPHGDREQHPAGLGSWLRELFG